MSYVLNLFSVRSDHSGQYWCVRPEWKGPNTDWRACRQRCLSYKFLEPFEVVNSRWRSSRIPETDVTFAATIELRSLARTVVSAHARIPIRIRTRVRPSVRLNGSFQAVGQKASKLARMAKKRKRTPKSILKLPDLEQSKSAVLNSLPSVSSQRSYDHAIRHFIDWYCSEPRLAFNRIVVTRYRIFLEQAHYASSTINLRLAAVRRLAYEAADAGLLSPDLAAGIRRVKGAKKHGARVGNWLTAEQGLALLSMFDRATRRGKLDYVMVAVLLGCGLRRAELAAAQVADLRQREEHWVFADLIGKGGHIRTVPISDWVAEAVAVWLREAGITEGAVFRAINKAGRIAPTASVLK